ncbi:MAG: hypothetical protein KJZ93_12160 [Caldilineaceae bacterium]|nr:hypothetical protein [Caldilineaceae bacterium]
MNRYLLTIVSLLAVLFWLAFSYAPGMPSLPALTFQAGWSGALLQALALAGLILFVLIQLFILWSTSRLSPIRQAESGPRVRLVAEFFWTALPLVMTIGLALLSYQTWLSVGN